MAHHMPAQDHPHQTYSAADEKLFSKVGWRLLPLLIVCYVISYIDRINIGYAQLQMEKTLSFSDAAYAFGAGIFFVGYFIFEVPSNLLLEKMGARKTLLRILFLWGLAAAGMAFVKTPMQFYVLRFLLGAFEAGFFPGVILYLTYWYPSARRAKAIAIFMTGAALGKLMAGPMSGGIMQYMEGWHGLHGWQWLFIVEGLPACILGLVAFFTLKDRPEDADWLSPEQKRSLRSHLDNDTQVVATASHASAWSLLRDPKVFTMALVYCLQLSVVYTVLFWTPTLVRSWGVQNLFLLGVLTALPAACGLIGMVLFGRSSDKHLERRWHYFATCAISAAGTAVMIWGQGNLVVSLAGLMVYQLGMSSATPLFFAALSEYMPKKTAAAGIGLVSSLGNLGPAFMPSIRNWLSEMTGGQTAGLYLMMGLALAAGVLLIAVIRPATAGGTGQLARA